MKELGLTPKMQGPGVTVGGSYRNSGDQGNKSPVFSEQEVEEFPGSQRVVQLETGLQEMRSWLQEVKLMLRQLVTGNKSLPERSSSSTTAGDCKEWTSTRSGLEPVYENEREELMQRNYNEDSRCWDRGITLEFHGIKVPLKWSDNNRY